MSAAGLHHHLAGLLEENVATDRVSFEGPVHPRLFLSLGFERTIGESSRGLHRGSLQRVRVGELVDESQALGLLRSYVFSGGNQR